MTSIHNHTSQRQLAHEGCRAVADPEILSKVKLNIGITVLVGDRTFFKRIPMNPLKFKDSVLTPRFVESERAAPYLDVARLVSADRLSGGQKAAA